MEVIFCFPDFNYLFIYFSFAIEVEGSRDNLASATEKGPVSQRRPTRVINNVYENTSSYENGHNVAHWRKDTKNSLVNKVCKFMSSLDRDDTVILRCSGHFATLKDCRFYQDGECVSDNVSIPYFYLLILILFFFLVNS